MQRRKKNQFPIGDELRNATRRPGQVLPRCERLYCARVQVSRDLIKSNGFHSATAIYIPRLSLFVFFGLAHAYCITRAVHNIIYHSAMWGRQNFAVTLLPLRQWYIIFCRNRNRVLVLYSNNMRSPPIS